MYNGLNSGIGKLPLPVEVNTDITSVVSGGLTGLIFKSTSKSHSYYQYQLSIYSG